MIPQVTSALIIPLGHHRLPGSNSSRPEEVQNHQILVKHHRLILSLISMTPCKAQISASALTLSPQSCSLVIQARFLQVHSWAVALFPFEGGSGKRRSCGTRQLTARKHWTHHSVGAGSSSRQSGCWGTFSSVMSSCFFEETHAKGRRGQGGLPLVSAVGTSSSPFLGHSKPARYSPGS